MTAQVAEPSTIEELPRWAQALIHDLRREAASNRVEVERLRRRVREYEEAA